MIEPSTNRSQYAADLARRGFLDLQTLSPKAKQELQAAGIEATQLEKIAGADRIIRGDEFSKIFELLNAPGTAVSTQRSNDLQRAQRVYAALRGEVSTSGEKEPTTQKTMRSDPAAFGVGLREEMSGVRRRAPGAKSGTSYAAADLPNLKTEAPPEEESCWFVAMLECLFSWLPGVTDHTDRLRAYGRDLANRHGSDLQAFRRAFEDGDTSRTLMGTRSKTADDAMIAYLADRLQRDAKGRGETMEREDALEQAGVVVGAMSEQLAKNVEADTKRTGRLPATVKDKNNPEAGLLASRYVPARQAADALGADWGRRLDRALSQPSAHHPMMKARPELAPRVANLLRAENVASVQYLMALQRGGQLDGVPPQAIDALLREQARGRIDATALRETVNALQSMPPAERTALLKKIRSVPQDRRAAAWATLAREHYALRSSKPSERKSGLARIQLATQQLEKMNAKEADLALERGTLGLEKDSVKVKGVEVPLYFHPGVGPEKRETYKALVADAYKMMPRKALAAMVKGEGGHPFNVQFLPEASIESGMWSQSRPIAEAPIGGFFHPRDNMVRLNADEVDRRIEKKSRDDAVHYVLHESSHYLDDLGDAKQARGFFLETNAKAAQAQTHGDGELAPAWAHFRGSNARFKAMRDGVDDPKVLAWYTLQRKSNRTDAENQKLEALSRHYASKSGSVSQYQAMGGDDAVKSRGVRLAEWWAETSASYLNPKRRAHLRAVDPVAHQAAETYFRLIETGASPDSAMRKALRFSLSTEVSARQGQRMLEGELTDKKLDDLDGIATAFEQHAKALDGWKPYKKDGDLIKHRKAEATGGVTEGKALLAQMDKKLKTMKTGTKAHARLAKIRKRLSVAVEGLGAQAKKL